MSLLVTKPYDPWDPVPWVREVAKMGQSMLEQRERLAVQERMHKDQVQQQELADQRRAFEFDRRMEFDRARTAADDNRADRALTNSEAENAPFVMPGSGGPPSSTVPALPTKDGEPSGGLEPLPKLDDPNGTADTNANDDDQFGTDASGNPVLLKPGNGTVGAAMAAMPRDAKGRTIPGATAAPATAAPATADATTVMSGDIPGLPADLSTIPGMPGAPHIDLEDGTPAPAPSAGVPRLSPAGAAPEMPLMPSAPLPPAGARPQRTPAENVAEVARSLSGSGLSKKQATAVIAHVAGTILSKDPAITGNTAAASKPIVRNFADGSTQQWDAEKGTWVKLAEKKTADSETMAEAVGDATYNKSHGTYVRPDGSEFFLNKGANGRFTQKAFRPDQKPAKILWGSDGEIYPHDAHGQPLKPVPDGVILRDHAAMQVAKSPGGGVMIVDPDGTLKPLIPDGIKMDAKSQDKYVEAAKTLRQAQVELDTQTKLLKDNPGTTGWFGGGTQSAVDAAQKKFDTAKAEVEGMRNTFPQLKPSAVAGGAVQKVTTRAQFEALPSGAEYVNEEGKRFRKP